MKKQKRKFGAAQGLVSQSGFSMIEVLVTLLIISLALLGTAGLQIYSMRLNQGGQFRTQAVFLVADLAERIEANKSGAVDGNYLVANSNVPAAASTACVDGPCPPLALAGFDLAQWQNAVAATLPQSSWTVAHDGPANPITYTITIGWVDRQGDSTNAAFDVGSQLGSNAAGTGERFFYTATRTILN
jgi:type IV pilus assembly protein PilV